MRNKEKRSKYFKEYVEKNSEKLKEYNRDYYLKNKEKKDKYLKEYMEKNSERLKQYRKEYYQKNKERLQNSYNERLKNDELFNLKESIRKLIYTSIRKKNFTKNSRTYQILGCTYQHFKEHLESQFESWMNWDNKGKYNGEFNFGWDIDHVIPTSSATTEKELIELNHYTNLKPLCSKINRVIKGNKF